MTVWVLCIITMVNSGIISKEVKVYPKIGVFKTEKSCMDMARYSEESLKKESKYDMISVQCVKATVLE